MRTKQTIDEFLRHSRYNKTVSVVYSTVQCIPLPVILCILIYNFSCSTVTTVCLVRQTHLSVQLVYLS